MTFQCFNIRDVYINIYYIRIFKDIHTDINTQYSYEYVYICIYDYVFIYLYIRFFNIQILNEQKLLNGYG
jgi:hypothetical protein